MNIDANELARSLAVERAQMRHDLIRRLGECRSEWLLDQVVEDPGVEDVRAQPVLGSETNRL